MASDIIPIARFAARKRVDALLSDKDPDARVAAMPAADLYFLIKDIGLDDAHELVALASPEQMQTFLDLDGWSRDQLEDAAIRPWLAALTEASFEKVTEVWRGLDPELTALILSRWTRIYNLAEEEVPDWEEPPFIPTPDRFFMLKVLVESPDDVKLVERLIDALYRGDQVLASHTIRSAQTEAGAELEETAYRWRSGRMQDLGYADYYQALEVYRPIDLAKLRIGEQTADRPPEKTSLPTPIAEAVKQPFLARVLARIEDREEAERLEGALVLLVNQVLSANRIQPADENVAVWASFGAATLSLGLETLARGDVERGVEALRTVALSRLHRAGHTVIAQLSRLARALGPLAARSDEPLADVVAGLRRARPMFSRRLDPIPAEGTRPFAQVADVRATTAALARLAAEIAIVRDLLGAEPPPARTLGDVGRTAVARARLGGIPSAIPLTGGEVARLPDGSGQPLQIFQALAAEKKIGLPPEFPAVIAGWVGDLERDPGDPANLLLE